MARGIRDDRAAATPPGDYGVAVTRGFDAQDARTLTDTGLRNAIARGGDGDAGKLRILQKEQVRRAGTPTAAGTGNS